MNRLELRVSRIKEETADAYTLFLENTENEAINYLPGQYITLILTIDNEEHRRAYSLSSYPGESHQLAITIKRVEGGLVSNYLKDSIKEGDFLKVLKPMGNFRVEPILDRSRHYLCFAAGSGITPIMSMTKAVLEEEPLSKLSLWYGNRDEASIIFEQELKTLKKKYPDRFEVKYYLSRPSATWKGNIGWVNFDTVYQEILELFMVDEYRKQYFICGPSPMMTEVFDALEKHAIHPSDIHSEYFSIPLHEAEEEAEEEESFFAELPEFEDRKVEIVLEGKAQTVQVKANTDILTAVIEAGLDPAYACRSGLCVSCKAKKVSGEVYMNEWVSLSEEELANGEILTCQAKPLSDDVSIDFDAFT
ncbi:MAG: ferredoxin--NADP reductase [Bacteroidia bacterium]|nr:ferredoxin--NADP reductase [Bacteroidia bacterium]